MLILPSFSENLGLVIGEALAHRLPVITTKATPWKEIVAENAGWYVEPNIEGITNALNEAMSTSKKQLKEKGKNGQNLIKRKYLNKNVTNMYLSYYMWLLEKDNKPDFVL